LFQAAFGERQFKFVHPKTFRRKVKRKT